jgi:hypothetical protein
MHVMSVARFEHFFRAAAGLDIDKADLKRYTDFVNQKIYDLLLSAQAAAKANLRDVIQPYDLPITQGLRKNIKRFRKLDEEIELWPVLEHLAIRPRLDLALSADTEARLPEIAGGLSVALGRVFRIIDPKVKNPQSEQWERCIRLFDELF